MESALDEAIVVSQSDAPGSVEAFKYARKGRLSRVRVDFKLW
jgi:hypothetical protein